MLINLEKHCSVRTMVKESPSGSKYWEQESPLVDSKRQKCPSMFWACHRPVIQTAWEAKAGGSKFKKSLRNLAGLRLYKSYAGA